MYASNRGYVEIVRLLLDRPEIDIDNIDKEGETALMRASNSDRAEIVKSLIYGNAVIPNTTFIKSCMPRIIEIINTGMKCWSKITHIFHPQYFRSEVFQWLLVCNRIKFNKDIRIMVIKELGNLFLQRFL